MNLEEVFSNNGIRVDVDSATWTSPAISIDKGSYGVRAIVGTKYGTEPPVPTNDIKNVVRARIRFGKFDDKGEFDTVSSREYTEIMNKVGDTNFNNDFANYLNPLAKGKARFEGVPIDKAVQLFNLLNNKYGGAVGGTVPLAPRKLGVFCRACKNWEFYEEPDGLPDGKVTCYNCKTSAWRKFIGVDDKFRSEFLDKYGD